MPGMTDDDHARLGREISGVPNARDTRASRTFSDLGALALLLHGMGCDPREDGRALVAICSLCRSAGRTLRVERNGDGLLHASCSSGCAEAEVIEALGQSAPLADERPNADVDDHDDEASSEAWSQPVPLGGGPRPAFPLAALPSVVRAQVAAVAESIQVPVDLAAAMALGVLSAAAGGFAVQVRPDWHEPLAIYVCAVAESGEGKGPTVKALAAPLEALERERIEEARELVAIGQAKYDTMEQRLKQARTVAAKADAGSAEGAVVADVAAELARMRRPELPRLLADDATPEALVSLLARHGRIAVMSDEGGLIDTLAGRYSDGVANLDAVLKAWSQHPIRVDRKGREAEWVQRPVLTLCLAVQPVVVERLASDPLLRGRGLPARFLWFWPHTRLGRRRDDASPIPLEVDRAWNDLIRQLASLAAEPAIPAEPNASDGLAGSAGSAAGAVLTIDNDAAEVFRAFKQAIEERLRPEDGDLYPANGWAGKLPGQVARIAGLLHLAEHRAAGIDRPISPDAMRAAVAIGLYLVDHALAAFGLEGPGGQLAPDARRLLSWIAAAERQTFSHREAHDALRSKARQTSDEWRPVIDLLERLGYVRRREAEATASRGGRPPSPVFEVNPLIPA